MEKLLLFVTPNGAFHVKVCDPGPRAADFPREEHRLGVPPSPLRLALLRHPPRRPPFRGLALLRSPPRARACLLLLLLREELQLVRTESPRVLRRSDLAMRPFMH